MNPKKKLIEVALPLEAINQASAREKSIRAISWFETHGINTGPYGMAETLATARGVSVAGVVQHP